MACTDADADIVFFWCAREPNGALYRVSAVIPGLGHMLLSARSHRAAMMMRPYAQAHARETGCRVWLRRYDTFTDLEDA